MTGVIPGDLRGLFAVVRAAASRGTAKAKLFLEDRIHIGQDVYARRNHHLTQIMEPVMQDRRKAAYAFLRGDTPFCPPAARVRQLQPWNLYDGLPGNLQTTFQRAPLHAVLLSRSYLMQDEARSRFLQWIAAAAQACSQRIKSCMSQDYPTFREGSRMVSALSWATLSGTMVRDSDCPGFRSLHTIRLSGTSLASTLNWCRSSNDRCPLFQFWQWSTC